MSRFTIVEEIEQKSAICRSILSALPQWFGRPAAIDSYVKAAEILPMLVARSEATAIGFLTLKPQTPSAVEAYVLGVRPDWHRKGVGSALFASAEKRASDLKARNLTVKTLAATHPDPHYRATRLFYEAMGFESIEVFPTLWDAETPCLFMLKRLD